jgi:hypothetical protein
MSSRAGPAAADEWSSADSMTVRVPPSAFPELPTSLVRWLTKCGCQIPQPYEQPKGEKANVIHGEFDHRGQTDWAVLCSQNRVSSIFVFWGGSPASVDTLFTAPDLNFLQEVDPGKIGYSRLISRVRPSDIRKRYVVWANGSKPPVPLAHDGIEDIFIGKGSGVCYRYQGKWLELAGAD